MGLVEGAISLFLMSPLSGCINKTEEEKLSFFAFIHLGALFLELVYTTYSSIYSSHSKRTNFNFIPFVSNKCLENVRTYPHPHLFHGPFHNLGRSGVYTKINTSSTEGFLSEYIHVKHS